MKNILEERAAQFIRKYAVSPKTNLLVSYSGGADSTFLLNLLAMVRDKSGCNLVAFYLNHNLRGKESVQEEKFIQNIIGQLSVPTIFYSKDIAKIAKEQKISTELCGRNVRREIIKNLMNIFECDYACLGHHLDDRVETYFFNTFRGSGIHGMTSIKEVSGKTIRPLIDLPKREILNCLTENNISFFEDSSNQENNYSRNKIRNIILPTIRENINPSVVSSIKGNIEILEEYESAIEKFTDIFIGNYVKRIGDFIYLSRELVLDEFFTPLILKEMLLKLMKEVKKQEKNIQKFNYEDLLELFLRNEKKCLEMDFPGGVKVFVDKKQMVLVPQKVFKELENLSFEFTGIDDVFQNKYFTISLKEAEAEGQKTFPLEFPFLLRSRRDGDKVVTENGSSKKKAKELLINNKISRYEKVFYPIIELTPETLFLANNLDKLTFSHKGKFFHFSHKS